MAPGSETGTCPQCRTERRPGAQYCHRCGLAFIDPIGGPPSGGRPSRRRRVRSVLIPILGIAILGIFGAVAAVALHEWRFALVILGAGVLASLAVVLPALFNS